MNLVIGQYGIYFGASNGENIGDIIVTGIHVGCSGANGTGVYVTPPSGSEYRSLISITNSQFDAGITTGIDMQGVNAATVQNISYGGATSYTISGYNNKVDGPNVSIARHGVKKDGIATGGSANLFTVEMPSFGGAVVDIETNGLAQCRGTAITTTRYHLTRSSGSVSVTQISNSQSGDGGAVYTHSTSVSTGLVTFSIGTNGTCNGSWAYSVIQVTGDAAAVTPQ